MSRSSKKKSLEFIGESRIFAFGSFSLGDTHEFEADEAAKMLALRDEGGNKLWKPVTAKPKEQDNAE